jgi:DNA mismatch repair protein MutS
MIDINEEPASQIKTTPMMAQWHACKANAKDALLLFRMGDFYEAFYEDAITLSKEIELTLTSRQGIPMAGIPHHASEGYIDKLVGKGIRVAIAEQTEDPKQAKGLVKREIVRIVTPGTLINSSLLTDHSNNFFAAAAQVGSLYGLAVIDLTTAEFRTFESDSCSDLFCELHRLRPAELLTSDKFAHRHAKLLEELKLSHPLLINTQEEWRFDHQMAYNNLTEHFGVHNLDSFGLKGMAAAINASGTLLTYLRDALSMPVRHIHSLQMYAAKDYLFLDRTTQRNLELTESFRDRSRINTLIHTLDHTHTPMGARLIRQWMLQPLLDISEIRRRQEAVEAFVQPASNDLPTFLSCIRDLERLMMKISSAYASPRDLWALKESLLQIPHLKRTLHNYRAPLIQEDYARLKDLHELVSLIQNALVEDPPMRINEGQIFRHGYCQELDELRTISRDGKSWIVQYQSRLREETGIKTLKVSFTNAFGYYIEVSKGQAERVPQTFQRRQTLVNSERFISPELKEYEQKVLTAEERIVKLEAELFNHLRVKTAEWAQDVWEIARAIARIDCLHSLAVAAKKGHYCKPLVDNSHLLHIVGGRHPVIEASSMGKSFTPNDTLLDDEGNRLILLTGPNMAGKSTYIRQVALIALMAHMGSFVPAQSAHIGQIDKIFTRIGASDDLSRGQSTFMVEMSETANILRHATTRSLVVLDEIGRGTSTYDGISIAWAVAEYLLTTEGRQAKTLFATHYWELTKLEERIKGAVNYNVAVQELNDDIRFLHKIVKGGTDKSYGIHVARLAGMPVQVVNRSKEILSHLEENSGNRDGFALNRLPKPVKAKTQSPKKEEQLLLFPTS